MAKLCLPQNQNKIDFQNPGNVFNVRTMKCFNFAMKYLGKMCSYIQVSVVS